MNKVIDILKKSELVESDFNNVAYKTVTAIITKLLEDNRYTEDDIKNAIEFGYQLRNNNKPINSGIDWVKEFKSQCI
jgi:hypothetical protein